MGIGGKKSKENTDTSSRRKRITKIRIFLKNNVKKKKKTMMIIICSS